MKKRILIISILIIIFSIFINTGNRSLTCNELFYKKIWKNKTYNFSVCIPINWWQLSLYSWNAYSNLDIPNESEAIWDGVYDEIYLLWNTKKDLWKYDIKSTFWNKEIIEHYFINNDWKKELGDFNYYLEIWKDKYYNFSFNKKTDEVKAIINSIKVLEEF